MPFLILFSGFVAVYGYERAKERLALWFVMILFASWLCTLFSTQFIGIVFFGWLLFKLMRAALRGIAIPIILIFIAIDIVGNIGMYFWPDPKIDAMFDNIPNNVKHIEFSIFNENLSK